MFGSDKGSGHLERASFAQRASREPRGSTQGRQPDGSATTVVGEGKRGELCAWTGGDGSIAPSIPSRDRAELRRAKQLGEPLEEPAPFILDEPEDGADSDDPRPASWSWITS